jgi:hypothetical protein
MSRRPFGVLCALAIAAVMTASSAADSPIFSTTIFFHITYRPDCTLMVAIDGGPSMDSTAPAPVTIPPGPYQVSVRTPLPDATWDSSVCSIGHFSFTGPDVNLASIVGNDLGPYSLTFNVTLDPASTYTIADAAHPTAPITFTTAATGSSSSLLPATPAPTGGTGKGSTQPDLMGSAIVPFRGTLTATVPSAGSPTLVAKGKPLATLKAGRYDIVVKDASTRGGFFVEKAHKKPMAIAGVTFTGKRTVHVTLTAGKWTFFSKSDKATSFTVTV